METKDELKKRLREIEEQEAEAKREEQRQKNYERFKERDEDWMIGKAHADPTFIGAKYFSDKQKPMIPVSVSVSGNCGVSYYPIALLTNSTKTYFHNVWEQSDRDGFQKRLNAFVQGEIESISRRLHNVLEMMGLQSTDYWVDSEHYPKDKLQEIKNDVEASRWEILDRYEDKDFLDLLRHRVWFSKETDEKEEGDEVDLSHSRMILYRYIFHKRPTLQERFKATDFYESWKERIEAKYD